MRRSGHILIMLLLFMVVPALITAEKRLEELHLKQLPDILKIRTYDDEGASDPVVITLEDLKTGQTYTDTTKNGIAEFDFRGVGIEEKTAPLATLTPNPISDYAELRIDPTAQVERVRVFEPAQTPPDKQGAVEGATTV